MSTVQEIYTKAVILLVLLLCLAGIPVKVFADVEKINDSVSRIAGEDRVETAINICSEGWSRSNSVILIPANQENLVDAISAISLAGWEQAPILLNDKLTLDQRVIDKILELKADKVYLVGAFQDVLWQELKGILAKNNPNIVVEIIKGNNRQETLAKTNAILGQTKGSFVIGSNAIADALSVSSYAYTNDYSFCFVAQAQANQYIIGGKNIVKEIPGSIRLAGADRYETNRAVVQRLNFNHEKVFIASGDDGHLADALAGAALAGKTGSAIYLTDGSGENLTELIQSKLTRDSEVTLLGGSSAISEGTKSRILGLSNSNLADNTDIKGIKVKDVQGLNLFQFTVKFDQLVSKESSEDVQNYIVNGRTLTSTTAIAELQADGRSVVVSLNTIQTQNTEMAIEIKEHVIYALDRNSSVPGYMGVVTLGDKLIPSVQSVNPDGNRKIIVKFTEDVCLTDAINTYQNWMLDGQAFTSKGLFLIKVIKGMTVNGESYGSGIAFYFSQPLKPGKHMLKASPDIPAEPVSRLFRDGAGFRLENQTLEFNVLMVSNTPDVRVVWKDSQTIFIEFDRPMYSNPQGNELDRVSVLNTDNFIVNGVQGRIELAEFTEDTDRKTVKLTLAPKSIVEGVNLIVINREIEDMYGNCLSDENNADKLRILFQAAAEKNKPVVSKVQVVTPNKIRIGYSEKVNGLYAQNLANYVLKDDEGRQVEINSIKALPDRDAVIQEGHSCTDIYELRLSTPIYGQGYTLRINTVQDLALVPNTMDTVTLNISSSYTSRFTVSEAIGVQNGTRLVILFSQSVNPNDLINIANYTYWDGNTPAEMRSLPIGTKVTTGPENKSAIIELPNGYFLDPAHQGIEGHNAKYLINTIQIMNMKDHMGNSLEGLIARADITLSEASTFKPRFLTDSFTISEEEGVIIAEFKLDQVIETLRFQDFLVGGIDNKLTANSGKTEGKKVTLYFTDESKMTAIRSYGADLRIFLTNDPQSATIAGTHPEAFPAAGYQVYDDTINPRVIGWSLEENLGDDYILIKFSEAVDTTVTGLYRDDFTFYYNGTDVAVSEVKPYVNSSGELVPDVLCYNLADGDYTSEGLTIRMNSEYINIHDVKDNKEDYNLCEFFSNL